MANLLLVLVVLVLVDIFLGIPALYLLYIFNGEFILILAVAAFGLLAPMIVFMLEMNGRKKYPIRVYVSYRIGEQGNNAKTLTYEDRLGYLPIRDNKDRRTGASEWRLRGLGKPVQNFNYDYVQEQSIWFGFKKAQICHVQAIMGLQGEEFRPIKFDARQLNEDGSRYVPVFDGDRGLLYHKITQAIENRNKLDSWWKQNLIPIIISALGVVISIMLFLCFLQLIEVSKGLQAAAGASAQCSENYKAVANTTATKPIAANNVAGIPFGATGG
jgi:hypothetical protein